jgi:hypothetical protein
MCVADSKEYHWTTCSPAAPTTTLISFLSLSTQCFIGPLSPFSKKSTKKGMIINHVTNRFHLRNRWTWDVDLNVCKRSKTWVFQGTNMKICIVKYVRVFYIHLILYCTPYRRNWIIRYHCLTTCETFNFINLAPKLWTFIFTSLK